jgi:hypothetical protein
VAALLGEAGEVARQIVAADHVEHDIDAAAAGDALHLLDEILRPVVDRVRGADLERAGAFLVRAGGDDHGQAEQLAEQDRRRADAAGAAVDQHRLARPRIAALEQVGPDGEEGLGQRRRFDHLSAARHGQALARRRGAIFGIAAAGDERADGCPIRGSTPSPATTVPATSSPGIVGAPGGGG